MTDEEAFGIIFNMMPEDEDGINALSAALSALRDRMARQNPQPLTLDALRGMDGEPVWVVFDDDSATWFLIFADNAYKPISLATNWGTQITLEEHKGHIKAIYRRPPEKEARD